MFLEGKFLEIDEEEAEKWLNLAAEQGHSKAKQCLLKVRETLANTYYSFALEYYSGTNGVPKDCEAAIKWCTKAANLGHDKAQYNLGSTYYYGNFGDACGGLRALELITCNYLDKKISKFSELIAITG